MSDSQLFELVRQCFGNPEAAVRTGVVTFVDKVPCLTSNGAKLVEYLITLAAERGMDTTEVLNLLIDAQATAAINQARRQLGASGLDRRES